MTSQPGTTTSPRLGLSPSRAADFKTCPLRYRFRVLDRLPEPATIDKARGTLVHSVLDRLFDLPPERRTPEVAAGLLPGQLTRMVESDQSLADLVRDQPESEPTIVDSARDLVNTYFTLEDPQALAPAEREYHVQTSVADGLLLHGYIDRLDVSASGDIRVVDYKTGGAPRDAFEGQALFQLKFYALVVWRSLGTLPRVLRLIYLKDAEVCDFTPDCGQLPGFERALVALRAAIDSATDSGSFRPSPSRLCDWCSHHQYCPAKGGQLPPLPDHRPTSLRDRR